MEEGNVMVVVEVPHPDDMDDEIFLKHLDKRHPEITHGRMLHVQPNKAKGWINPYRAYHKRMHESPEPADYDHKHEGFQL